MRLQEIGQPLMDGRYDPHIFKAVFMAGSPGSGKSTIAQKLFGGTGLKELNVDRFWELYNRMGKPEDYKRFHALATMQKTNWLSGRLGLLIDGTARRLDRMEAIKRELDSLGYDTAMIFVNTDLQTAMDRVRIRAERTGRDVPADKVTQAWKDTQKNLGGLQAMFGKNFFIVDNTDEPDLAHAESRMRRWLAQAPRKPEAREWLEDQGGASRASDQSEFDFSTR